MPDDIPEVLARRIVMVDVDDLIPTPGNPRRSKIEAIRESIRANGYFVPIIAQTSTKRIIAGHGRREAAVAEGIRKVPVVWLDVSDETAHRMLLVENASNDAATYDDAELLSMLQALAETEGGLIGTGFDDRAMVDVMARLRLADEINAYHEREVPLAAPRISQPGDLWHLGPHRLLVGSAADPASVARLLDGAVINLAFTSPPYAEQRAYDESTEFRPVPPDEYVDFFEPFAANVATHLAADGSWIVNIRAAAEQLDVPLYVMDLVIAHVRRWGWHYSADFCWRRPAVPRSVERRFKNGFEPIYQFTLGEWKFRPENVRTPSDNVPYSPGEVVNTSWDRTQGSVGGGAGAFAPAQRRRARRGGVMPNSEQHMGSDAENPLGVREGLAYPSNLLPPFNSEALGHPAAFPVGLAAFFVDAYTDAGDVVFDPFAGSGSTLVAAHSRNRIGYGVELSPMYADIVCKRFETSCDITPMRNGEPVTFLTDDESLAG